MSITENEIIKNVRDHRGLSQEQMAKALDVTANYISLIENGHKKPGMSFLEKVSSTYSVPMILLARDALIPDGNTKAEKEVRAKVINLIEDLERSFFNHEE